MTVKNKLANQVRKRKSKLTSMQVKQVKNIIRKGQELKYFDVSFADISVSDATVSYDLTNIAQGDTDITRDGNEITPYKSMIRLVLNQNDATTDHSVVRCFILRSRTDVAPASGEFIGQQTSSPVTWPDDTYYSDKNQTLVWERWYTLSHQSGTKDIVFDQIIKKIAGKVKYNGANAGDTGAGALMFFAVSTNPNADAVKPLISFHHRLLYTDA